MITLDVRLSPLKPRNSALSTCEVSGRALGIQQVQFGGGIPVPPIITGSSMLVLSPKPGHLRGFKNTNTSLLCLCDQDRWIPVHLI